MMSIPPEDSSLDEPTNRVRSSEPASSEVLLTLAISLGLVFLTRWPVARISPMESDEFGFLETIRGHWFPMHHTLFLTFGRGMGLLLGDAYRGFILLDMLMSGLALTSAWWWLRALVPPRQAAAGTLLLGVAPVFWGYGATAGNYTAIIAVGSFLLGIGYRSWSAPRPWHPIAAAVALGLGTGYRQDIGTFELPLLLVIFWVHRWRRAFVAGAIFTAINLAWILAMLLDNGGWAHYRAISSEFAYQAGYLNSVWSLGLVDAPLRYSVKLGIALLWTLGPLLLLVPRGLFRLRNLQECGGGFLAVMLGLSVLPPLCSHLLVHFGVPGYAFHYVPALLALGVLGACSLSLPAGDSPQTMDWPDLSRKGRWAIGGTSAIYCVAAIMAGLFLGYPADFQRPGWRGNFDLSFARHTRIGLRMPLPDRQPSAWRTANSRVAQGNGVHRDQSQDGRAF